VIGVGGGGTNAVNRMIRAKVEGVEFIAPTRSAGAQTVAGARKTSDRHQAHQGPGRRRQSEVGRKGALEDTEKIIEALEGSDMIFITAGLAEAQAAAPLP